ncbi:hypothetical protein Psal006b_00826 [Piscirickettsia salmonis]|uniref:2,3-dihydroxybenzoate-AMP ligase n=1 Tax=Piscirickettsia salmonis TaxID=1238 RepID=A0A1L6THD9_PISSA|nr:hypothetical protein [Piscirickettsia salmonis]AKP74563.2 hypothetical protein PSLF89_3043 [Piscirickettsia salmonis LF-89 = ATCC VR-1361]ALB23553.1 2,3-dihydroxybenzoate-AMP ligase [Piscirickettsia salmonis]ALY04275.1 hypothetical protein AWE47_11665 [Piscirickettsia salmonis]AMA43832.1 hypothetical protein AWJ11_11890 [Piscirickettsia salmonis]AOS36758.1 hypothetical protein AVM72_09020 [Piscirickettsia salmonis]
MANKLTRFIVQEIRQLRDTIQNKQENERWRWPATGTKRAIRIWLLNEMEKELLEHNFSRPENLEIFLSQWSDKIENFTAIPPNNKGIGKGKTISNFFNLGKHGNIFSMLRTMSAKEGTPFTVYTSLIDQIEQERERKRKLQKKSTPFFNQIPTQEEHYLSPSDTRAHEA